MDITKIFTYVSISQESTKETETILSLCNKGWGDLVQEIGYTCDGKLAMTDGCCWAKRLAAAGSHHHSKAGSSSNRQLFQAVLP